MSIKNSLILNIVVLVSFLSHAIAQGQTDSGAIVKSTIRGADNLKSGNYQDVLTSFFQLAAQDLTGDQHSFQFKSTLFAIKLRADSSLLIDRNYITQYGARNLQFNINLNLTNNLRFAGFTGGVTYAIINERDHSVANFFKTALPYNDSLYGFRRFGVYSKFIDSVRKTHEKSISGKMRLDSIGKMILDSMDIGGRIYDSIQSVKGYPRGFIKYITDKDKLLVTKIHRMRDSLYSKMDNKPLWTIAANASTGDSSGIFHSAILQSDFLWGGTEELNLHAKGLYSDTISSDLLYHHVAADISGGCNFALLKTRRAPQKHILELEGTFEYNHVFHGLLPNEKTNVISANAILRVRILNNIWIPVTVKYDITHSNLLGFLNISMNLDAFKHYTYK